MSRSSIPRLVAAALLALAASSCSSGPPPQRVLVFTVDTLRADQIGFYGSDRFVTHHIDELARRSLVFDAAYTQATLTVPALSSMWTGLQPKRTGVHLPNDGLAEGVLPLTLTVQSRDIATGSFIANICKMQEQPRTVFRDGWDVRGCGLDMDAAYEQWEWDHDTVDQALEWIDSQDGDWLCWIHLMDPHAEHRPAPRDWDYDKYPVRSKDEQYAVFNSWEEQRVMPPDDEYKMMWDLYTSEIRGADRQLGRVVQHLTAAGILDDVHIVFSSDHGEELYETWSRYDHGLSLSEGVLWIPMMVAGPGIEHRVRTEPVELLQVGPTVLELFDLPAPYELDGTSLLADDPSRGFAVSWVGSASITARHDEHRYWLRPGDEPWTREEAPWRADAPWFLDKHTLATYADDARTAVEFLDLGTAENRGHVQQYQQSLNRYRNGLQSVERQAINDPELLQSLVDTGYADLIDEDE